MNSCDTNWKWRSTSRPSQEAFDNFLCWRWKISEEEVAELIAAGTIHGRLNAIDEHAYSAKSIVERVESVDSSMELKWLIIP